MSLKNILAVLNDATNGAATLHTALRIARLHHCHVDALHVRPDPVAALPLVGEAMSGAMVSDMLGVAEREASLRAERTNKMYRDIMTQAGLRDLPPSPDATPPYATWLEDTGIEEQVVALRAGRADLTVLPRPHPENETASLMTLNAALMQSGRPVLAAPPLDGARADGPFARIALFWNGAPEVTRALSFAMPFLTAAAEVTVLRVEEEEWFAPTDDLEIFLAFHGVKAVVSKVLPRDGKTGRALLQAAGEVNADMMVMGAYTRSRLRQLILGSVTGYVMQNATLPVFLCH